MRDEADPPRKHYQLRPSAFERVNAVPPDAPTAEAIIAPATPVDGPIEVQMLTREAIKGKPLLGNPAAPGSAQ